MAIKWLIVHSKDIILLSSKSYWPIINVSLYVEWPSALEAILECNYQQSVSSWNMTLFVTNRWSCTQSSLICINMTIIKMQLDFEVSPPANSRLAICRLKNRQCVLFRSAHPFPKYWSCLWNELLPGFEFWSSDTRQTDGRTDGQKAMH